MRKGVSNLERNLKLFWHTLRAGYHWNRMIAKQEKTGLLHFALMEVDGDYRESSFRYDESISVLVLEGRYITARSLIAAGKAR